jgi:AcrR family transcriptional regulator
MRARSAAQVTMALDGRVRRGERSRQAIVTALFDLVGAGVVQPTAQQVAARAGVGIRTVFRHFSEMESLYAAMDGRLEGEVRPALRTTRHAGALAERTGGLVRQRVLLFERIAPYKRSANLQRWRSRFLQGRHRAMQAELRSDLVRWLPELQDAPEWVVDAVDLVTSFEAWDRLRGDQRLGTKAAAAVVERSVEALLRSAAARTSRTRGRG